MKKKTMCMLLYPTRNLQIPSAYQHGLTFSWFWISPLSLPSIPQTPLPHTPPAHSLLFLSHSLFLCSLNSSYQMQPTIKSSRKLLPFTVTRTFRTRRLKHQHTHNAIMPKGLDIYFCPNLLPHTKEILYLKVVSVLVYTS